MLAVITRHAHCRLIADPLINDVHDVTSAHELLLDKIVQHLLLVLPVQFHRQGDIKLQAELRILTFLRLFHG